MIRSVALRPGADHEGFRRAVRTLIAAESAPEVVSWSLEGAPDLFGAQAAEEAPAITLPRLFGELIELVVCHRDPERYALLYQLIWRARHGDPALLEVQTDPLVHRLERMRKSVRRDIHKMHAFLRFRRITLDPDEERFVAWFEPDHFILEAAAAFFVERFRNLAWSIITPLGTLHWDSGQLSSGPPGARGDAPKEDGMEAGWRAYFESTFNPARLNPILMGQHMPQKYWRNMPETQAIPALIRAAPARLKDMLEKEAAMPMKRDPEKAVTAMLQGQDAPQTLAELNKLISSTPPLVPGATQAVLGEGPPNAAVVFVGEQPGDQEDLAGRPFVGPAGQLLSRAMAEAGIERRNAYLTNAVKHFKFEARGKRRLHMKPTAGEVKHYRWWLMKELDFVQPRLVVALGATALLALAGKALPITRVRGPMELDGRAGYVTVHPSYLLRLPDEAAKQEAYAAFVADLRQVQALAA